MGSILKSKGTAWFALAVAIIVLVVTFRLRTVWWEFFDVFFMFMAAFINVVAVSVARINPIVSKKLNTCTLVFVILWIVSLIGEWVVFECLT
ncbi:MAG: hypothetical protein K2M41_05750 [Muribaculaceae bacterium]|nr:hypothetical protein [Muribaculaceae bacterium]